MACFHGLVALALIFVSSGYGQTVIKQEWVPQEFPNPRTEAVSCGFKNNYPAFICDPNGILGSDVKEVNWILADAAYNRTKCPCSTYYCETSRDPKGYRIGVALARRMKPQRSVEGKLLSPEDTAQKFAYVLSETGWKMGKCEEDIIIFYSVDDKMLAMYTGRTAGMKLTPYYRDLLAYKIGPRLEDGRIVEALNILIHDIKTVLNCGSGLCSLYEAPKSSSTQIASGSLVVMLCLFLVSMISH